jgi:hypothetical protein
MVAKAGAGPDPIPHASLDPDNLAAAIKFCITPEATSAALEISIKMQSESGVAAAVDSFHRNLPLDRMRCSIIPNQVAVWTYGKEKESLNLSKTAVSILIEHNRIDAKQLKCHAINPILIENRRWDPLTGVLSAATGTGENMLRSTGEMFYNPYKEYKRGRSARLARASGSSQDLSRPTSSTEPASHSTSSLTDPAQSQSSQPPLHRSMSEQSQNSSDTAGNMIGAGMKGFGKFSATYFRGMVVDIPHAAAEGFRRAPQLYGEKPKDYGTVQDWKSGIKVGGKNFVGGMAGGVKDIITYPIKGALAEGGPGALRGLARGAMGMATKMPSGEWILFRYAEQLLTLSGFEAGIGLTAYPFYGISKSIEAAFRTKTPKAIVSARLRDGHAHASRIQLSQEEEAEILQVFDALWSSMSV